ncbi:uncharacterized protein CLUP02_00545 [Colletotrichum lupini]|uniref:Uncharacterized protein n=1 Tax=Colletotrichum lupini TaxID=145971 RepID=A0A9Q8W7A0_9PEZI|nr:uncharacterized protein CLUP02_00545 [Colletotrichum lupini]UQC73898.1 hypothetical protein CLUP02_00545 [Colletotrichum lupini]
MRANPFLSVREHSIDSASYLSCCASRLTLVAWCLIVPRSLLRSQSDLHQTFRIGAPPAQASSPARTGTGIASDKGDCLAQRSPLLVPTTGTRQSLVSALAACCSLPLIDISSRLSGVSEFDFQVLGSCLGSNEVTRRMCRVGDDIGAAIISFSSNVYLTTQVSLSSRSCQLLLSLRSVIAMTSAHTLSILHSFAVKKPELPLHKSALGYVSLVGPLHAVQLLRAAILVASAPSSASSSFTPNKSRFQQHLQGARHDPLHPLAKGGNERGVDLRKPQAKCRYIEAMLYEIRISGRRLLRPYRVSSLIKRKKRTDGGSRVLTQRQATLVPDIDSPLISYKADWVAPRRRAVNHSTCSHFDATASFVQSRRLLTLRRLLLPHPSLQSIKRSPTILTSVTHHGSFQCFSVPDDNRPQCIHELGLRVISFFHYEPSQLQHHLATNVAQSATYTDTPAQLRILRPAPAGSTHLTNASGHRPRSPRPTPTPTHPKHQNSVPGIWLTFRWPHRPRPQDCARAWPGCLLLPLVCRLRSPLSRPFCPVSTACKPDRWEGTSRLRNEPVQPRLELKLRTGVWTGVYACAAADETFGGQLGGLQVRISIAWECCLPLLTFPYYRLQEEVQVSLNPGKEALNLKHCNQQRIYPWYTANTNATPNAPPILQLNVCAPEVLLSTQTSDINVAERRYLATCGIGHVTI